MSLNDILEDKPEMTRRIAWRIETDSWNCSQRNPLWPRQGFLSIPDRPCSLSQACSRTTGAHRFCGSVWICCFPSEHQGVVKIILLIHVTETRKHPVSPRRSGLSSVGITGLLWTRRTRGLVWPRFFPGDALPRSLTAGSISIQALSCVRCS